MGKNYPLVIEPLVEFQGGGNVVGYWSKGHHDPALFMKLLPDFPEWFTHEVPDLELSDVEHALARNIPDGDGGTWLKREYLPGRGAFPITVLYFYDAANKRLALIG